ncbi:MAG: hypothetical protein M1817_002538 [Caeruleum heppii]|nr:MAG: hypothetical protein M1817_002538 [Caeruleum heppii]
MSPDAGSVGVWSSLRQNCECFVHLYKAYRKGLPTPFQIPIRVRAKLSFEQRKALDRFAWRDQARWSATSVLNWFSNLTNPWDQGQHLTVLLELIIEDEGPTRGLPFLKNLLKGLQQIEGLQHVTEEQLSNLIATFTDFPTSCARYSTYLVGMSVDL